MRGDEEGVLLSMVCVDYGFILWTDNSTVLAKVAWLAGTWPSVISIIPVFSAPYNSLVQSSGVRTLKMISSTVERQRTFAKHNFL